MAADLKNVNSSGVSFGFTKTLSKKILESSVINEADEKGKDAARAEPTQTWVAKPQTEDDKLVIPLKSGNWQQERRRDDVRKDSKNRSAEVVDEATDAAVREILAEAKQAEGEGILSIAIATQNADGTDRGSGLLRRTQRRDEDREIEDEDYEKIPVGEFGKAMLRGMGWKDEEDSSSKAYEGRPRPQGLGLGANVPLHSAAYAVKSRTGNAEEEKLMLKTGAHCQVLTGKLEGQYGTVTGVEEDTVRVYVTMSLSGENVTLSQYAIKLVTKTEYDKEHRYINKKLVEKYKSENGDLIKDGAAVRETRESRERDRNRRHRDDDDADERNSSKRKSHQERDDEKAKRKKKDRDGSVSSSWIHPCLRVRFVDEKFKSGKYFKTKVVIIDVVSQDSCICRTENGQLLEGIHQDQLETVIPRDLASTVMIVKGSHRSQLGEIVEKDKERCKAVVQVIPDREEVLTLDYDSICEYVGHID